MFYLALKHAHSGFRWVVLILLIVAIVQAYNKRKSGVPFAENDRKLSLFALIATHVQFLIGLVLYFVSPFVQFSSGFMKDPMLRFYSVEHISLMLIAVALITVGFSRAKKAAEDSGKFRTIFIFYLIGLLLILISIPWPFRDLGGSWF